jgi:hypothetical protein
LRTHIKTLIAPLTYHDAIHLALTGQFVIADPVRHSQHQQRVNNQVEFPAMAQGDFFNDLYETSARNRFPAQFDSALSLPTVGRSGLLQETVLPFKEQGGELQKRSISGHNQQL